MFATKIITRSRQVQCGRVIRPCETFSSSRKLHVFIIIFIKLLNRVYNLFPGRDLSIIIIIHAFLIQHRCSAEYWFYSIYNTRSRRRSQFKILIGFFVFFFLFFLHRLYIIFVISERINFNHTRVRVQ